jgi:ferric-dicitrate binding protein FerR (iron transport regulator)
MRQNTSTPQGVRPVAEAAATDWALRLAAADPSEELLAAFATWLLAHPGNAEAWDRLERLETDLRRIARQLADQADQQVGHPAAEGEADQ